MATTLWLVALLPLLSLVEGYPQNEYEFSIAREWLKRQEWEFAHKRIQLSEDERTVDQYLSYLKWDEFQQTRPTVPPLLPIEVVLPHVLNSTLFAALKPLPKGGNMHLHEHHILSKMTLLDIVWESEDFEHLYIMSKNSSHPNKLDFFINPPQGEGWIKVKDSNLTKEEIYKTQVFMGIMDDYAKRYPTNSRERWRQMNPLWDRGSIQIINNINIKTKHIERMLEFSLAEGVQYLEARRSLDAVLYTLDASSEYTKSHGKRYLDTPEEGALNDLKLTHEVIANFTRRNPSFIGYRNIAMSQRFRSVDHVQGDIERTIKFHRRYPNWVVGYDLVAEEDAGRANLFFLENLLTLYNDTTKRSNVNLYLHTGETNFPGDLRTSQYDNDPVATLENTYEAVVLGANRIGHGIGYIKHPYLLQLIKERQVAIESCPISNQILGFMADLRNHPAINYIKSGIPVVMGSDDPGTFGYDYFTVDWYMAYLGWGLDLADMKQLAINSLNYSAMNEQDKTAAMTKWENAWAEYIRTTKESACAANYTNTPSFSRILPREGSRRGSTKVYIFGHGFEKGICKQVRCKFGTRVSESTRLESSQLITCETPVLSSRQRIEEVVPPHNQNLILINDDEFGYQTTAEGVTVPVQVSFDGGKTFQDVGQNFTYKYDTFTLPPAETRPTVSSSDRLAASSGILFLYALAGVFIHFCRVHGIP